jgi:ABC-2 type transport system ATP-binding protein
VRDRAADREAAGLAEIMDSLGLAGKRDAFYRSLSGGLKQRLSVALALIGQSPGRCPQ